MRSKWPNKTRLGFYYCKQCEIVPAKKPMNTYRSLEATAMVLFLCFLKAGAVFATVSCDSYDFFVGFSADLENAYIEDVMSGDCEEDRTFRKYSFKNNVISIVADQKELGYNKYAQVKKKIYKEGLTRPESFIQDDIKKVDIVMLGRNNRKRVAMFSYQDRQCKFNTYTRVESEAYLPSPAEMIREAYYNPKYDSWVVIREHCYVARRTGHTSLNCDPYMSIGILNMQECVENGATR